MLDRWLRQVLRLRRQLEGAPYHFRQQRFLDLQILAELLFRAVDYAIEGKEDSKLSESEKRSVLENFRVANVTQTAGHSIAGDRDGEPWNAEEFLCVFRKPDPVDDGRAEAMQRLLQGIATHEASGLIEARWGTGRSVGTVHIGAAAFAPRFNKFLTLKTNGIVQVCLPKSGLDKGALTQAGKALSALADGAFPPLSTDWCKLAGGDQSPLWSADPDLARLEAFVRHVGELAHQQASRTVAPAAPPQPVGTVWPAAEGEV